MNLRIYAIVVTMLLLAAVTNPPASKHYEKLGSAYPWVYETLLEEAQDKLRTASAVCGPDEELAQNELLLSPRLAYKNLGVASFVRADEWTPLGSAQAPTRMMSFGLLGYVFTAGAKEPADEEAMTPAPEEPGKPVESSPDARFFAAYAGFNEAQRLLRQGRREKATASLRNVLEELEVIKSRHPNWQPMVVDFRLEKTREQLDELSERMR